MWLVVQLCVRRMGSSAAGSGLSFSRASRVVVRSEASNGASVGFNGDFTSSTRALDSREIADGAMA